MEDSEAGRGRSESSRETEGPPPGPLRSHGTSVSLYRGPLARERALSVPMGHRGGGGRRQGEWSLNKPGGCTRASTRKTSASEAS